MTNFARVAAVLVALLTGGTEVAIAAADDTFATLVELESPLTSALPLQGYLRLPDGAGPSPAVVLLHGCGGYWRQLDERWGKRLAAWGYVTLTIDRFGPRGLSSTCAVGPPATTLYDAYHALDFLAAQSSVDADRIAVMGFSQGAWLALISVERGVIERSATRKFRAAIGFYPPCLSFKDDMTVPTLILVGEFDDWTPAKACRNLADGRDDWGVSREKGKGTPIDLIVYPGAYHDFDVPDYKTPGRLLGHHLEFNQAAADQSVDAVRKFLYATIGAKEKLP